MKIMKKKKKKKNCIKITGGDSEGEEEGKVATVWHHARAHPSFSSKKHYPYVEKSLVKHDSYYLGNFVKL